MPAQCHKTALVCASAAGVGVQLADDLPGTGSKFCACGPSGNTEAPGSRTASRPIVGKPDSYALRAEPEQAPRCRAANGVRGRELARDSIFAAQIMWRMYRPHREQAPSHNRSPVPCLMSPRAREKYGSRWKDTGSTDVSQESLMLNTITGRSQVLRMVWIWCLLTSPLPQAQDCILKIYQSIAIQHPPARSNVSE